MQLINGIPIWGDPIDEGALSQIKTCAQTAHAVALMADHHKGYSVPIGGVVVYRDRISPSGVGFDIACGNKAVLTDATFKDIKNNIPRIMDDIWNTISFGIGRKNKEDVDHELFDDETWKLDPCGRHKEMARSQLGTVGSGNHYVDIFRDEQDRIWVGVHFGSRGFGHQVATHFLKLAGASDGMDVPPCELEIESNIGTDYLRAMELAGRYAYAGRDWVCSKVASILGADILEEVHNHHNFAWQELHNGELFWVVRKGATPAFPGQKGFVGGTMGENSVILQGTGLHGVPSLSWHSTVHGAGRIMSRTAARGKIRRFSQWQCGDHRVCDGTRELKDVKYNPGDPHPKCPLCEKKMYKNLVEQHVSSGLVSHDMMNDWVKKSGIELRGADLDESPDCYKRLNEVLNFHKDDIMILHTLTPLGVCMAGKDTHDPYKD